MDQDIYIARQGLVRRHNTVSKKFFTTPSEVASYHNDG
jgi:hypothetical protein